jgi:hypothetical protein
MEINLISGSEGFDNIHGTVFAIKEAACITMGLHANPEHVLMMTNEDIFDYLKDLFIAEHSLSKIPVIRIIDKMDKNVRNQIFRHTKASPHFYAQSSRPDWNKGKARDQNEFTNNVMDFNVEAFLAMAKQRLCYKTEKNTRIWMESVVDYLKKSDNPIFNAIAFCSVPQCIYRYGCPELKSCGFFDKKYSTNKIETRYSEYHN